jgi:hypothetical protein
MTQKLLLIVLSSLINHLLFCHNDSHAPSKIKPLKIFILAGQSNMVGFGTLAGPQGTMEAMLQSHADKYGHLVDDNNRAIARNDVWLVDLSNSNEKKQGFLSTGFGKNADFIGPEYAFGQEIGDHFTDPVLLLKCAWGGKSLYHDFLPPSIGNYSTPTQAGDPGFYYAEIIRLVKEVTKNLKKYCPVYKGTSYEIAGFAWHQGWNDRINQEAVNVYEKNLVHFIEDIRRDLKVEKLPFVIANTGMSGWQMPERYRAKVEQHLRAQLAVGDFKKYPQFKGNVATVETRDFRRAPTDSPAPNREYHWYNNWESYYLIGKSMGQSMLQLLNTPPKSTPAINLLTQQSGDNKVNIDAVFLAQTHVQKPDDPYFVLTANREALLKVHLIAPYGTAAPEVSARLINSTQSIDIKLSGPQQLPQSIPSEPGLVVHQFSDSFTATLPKEWIQPGLKLQITAGKTSYERTIHVGPPNPISLHMFDIDYFGLGKKRGYSDYPDAFFEELWAKWPVSDLTVQRIGPIVFHEMVIPARGGYPTTRVRSKDEYREKNGAPFDGEQAAALKWVDALSQANGFSKTALTYINIIGVHSGGQAGNFKGVGQVGHCGIAHHELGHALGLPHWGEGRNKESYPYKGTMYGILPPPTFHEVHVGPTWGYDSVKKLLIPPTVQKRTNKGNKLFEVGMFRHEPMQGGGFGTQDPPFLVNHFSDYSVYRIQAYLKDKLAILVGDDYCKWDPETASYHHKVSTRDNRGIDYPLKEGASVYSIMAACSLADKSCNLIYPPIGPYDGNLMLQFDPRKQSERANASNKGFVPKGGCDFSLRIAQGSRVVYYMLPLSARETDDTLDNSSLKTSAINVDSQYGPIQSVHLLHTPDAEINGLPKAPLVLDKWEHSTQALKDDKTL